MSKELDSAVNDIKQTFSTNELFGKNISLDAACKKYLELRNYKIIEEPILEDVKTVEDLVNKFYDLMEFHYDSKVRTAANPKKDVALLSNFVEQRRLSLDTTFRKALVDCITIIKSLFIFKEDLGLNRPIGTWIFGTDKCKWITDKVIVMINEQKDAENEMIMRRMSEQYEEETEKSIKGLL